MPRHIALIPAAGTGSRMGTGTPKQYLDLRGKPMLYHSVRRLALHPAVERVIVALDPGDRWFSQHDWSEFAAKLDARRCGGHTRAHTVRNALESLHQELGPEDWVLVHDAARPCLSAVMLDRLIGELSGDAVGGLLAVPVADTLKRGDLHARVIRTEAREHLWRAQTPQMFRYGMLLQALRAGDADTVTDEATAVEHLGLHPKLVMGGEGNLKVTYREDLALAAQVLEE